MPENVQITETEAGNDDGDDVADFGEDEEDVDVDDIWQNTSRFYKLVNMSDKINLLCN